jgi:glycosyltransferase 2 family protein
VKKRLRLLGSLILIGVLVWRVNWNQLLAAFASVRPVTLLAAAGVYVAAQLVSALRWRMIARPLGFHAPFVRFVDYLFVGMFFNLVLPTSVGGDVVRAWYLSRDPDGGGPGRRSAAFVTVFVDRCSGLILLIALACIATLFVQPLDPRLTAVVAGVGACALLGCLVVGLFTQFGPLPGGRHDQETPPDSAARIYRSEPVTLTVTSTLSLLIQLMNIVLVWILGQGMNLPVPFAYYAIAVPLVTLLTLIPISLNGMGLRELGMVLVLAPLGVTAAQAAALSVLQFAVMSLVSLSGGVFYLRGRRPAYQAGEPKQVAERRAA